jgi:hypothetical protein
MRLEPVETEAEFQAQVVELATICGWTWLHVRKSIGRRNGKSAWQTTTNLKGWVDLLLWRPGRMIAVELKSRTGKTTPEQDAVLASLAEAGVETYVWRPSDWDEIAAVLGRRTAHEWKDTA